MPHAPARVAVPLLIAQGLACTALGQNTLRVDDSAPPGGDGSSWATAFRFLQDALDATDDVPSTEIRVAGGVYPPDRSEAAPTGTGDRLATFLLRDGVAILGGYAGLAGPDPDERDPDAYPSTLTGDLLLDDLFGTRDDNAYHVVESWGNDATAVLDGVAIVAGHADRPFEDGWWPDRRDDSGAGAIVVDSEAVFRDCHFFANHAEANASVWVALDGPFAFAEAGSGAVLVAGGAPAFEGCLFTHNTANRIAGALGLNRSPARITRCVFRSNRVGLPGFPDANYGGAIGDSSADFSTPERARVESCVFIGNTQASWGGGGALFTIFSDTVYANCLFAANQAEGAGGAIMADNVAFVEFHNCTIYGNHAEEVCGGVYEFSEVSDTYVFANSIVWGNTVTQPTPRNPNMVSESGNFALHDSIIGDIFTRPVSAFDTSRLFDDDPRLANPGGAGDAADFHPLPASPAIDNGNSSRVPAWVAADLDGKPRFLDDPTVADTGIGPGPVVDIGAYEGGRGCTPADLAEPYSVLDLADVQGFIAAFLAREPPADLAVPIGVYDLADLHAFVLAFTAGCP